MVNKWLKIVPPNQDISDTKFFLPRSGNFEIFEQRLGTRQYQNNRPIVSQAISAGSNALDPLRAEFIAVATPNESI